MATALMFSLKLLNMVKELNFMFETKSIEIIIH